MVGWSLASNKVLLLEADRGQALLQAGLDGGNPGGPGSNDQHLLHHHVSSFSNESKKRERGRERRRERKRRRGKVT